MEAIDIRTNGKLIKAWKEKDGAWYTNSYEVWKVGDKYYEIKNHECVTFAGTGSYWGKVTEIEKPTNVPTHLCIIFGQYRGEAYIAAQQQGTPEELAEWAAEYLKKEEIGYRGEHRNLSVKVVELKL